MEKLDGWNGPFFEQLDTWAVYVDQHRYWINIKNGTVMDADPEVLEIIENDLAKKLRVFVVKEMMKNPNLLEDKKPHTFSIIPTDEGKYVMNDSLLRVLSDLPEEIQEKKGKGDDRQLSADVMQSVELREFKGKKETYMCSKDVVDMYPDLLDRILNGEKASPL
jgi:hypothetical protein